MARSGKTWTGALVVLALIQATTLLRPATAQVDPPDLDEIRKHYSLYWEHFKNGRGVAKWSGHCGEIVRYSVELYGMGVWEYGRILKIADGGWPIADA